MKQFSIFILVFAMIAGRLTAGTVSPQTAQTVALNFYKSSAPLAPSAISAQLTYTRMGQDGRPDFYVFDIAGAKGFVIVAAYDNTQPVIAYSTESNFSRNFAGSGVSTWMKHAAANIDKANSLHIQADTRIENLWTGYLSGVNPQTHRSGSVSPLVATTWDQSPYYNDLCPYNAADGQNAVTGCVATAMAQIMKFWNYPAHGVGSNTYDDTTTNGFSFDYGIQSANFNTNFAWGSMPNSVTGPDTAVATLMYDCGVSVSMDYGDDNQGGSGAWVCQLETGPASPCSEYAFRHYFLYDPNSMQGLTAANYTSLQWVNILETDLDNGMPILYDGDEASGEGHAWVCDGYDVTDMFHMNWGWSGQDNGYFAINNLNPGSFVFSTFEDALIGIQPMNAYSIPTTAAASTICQGDSTILTAHGPAGATYTWLPTTGLSCTGCASPVSAPPATTTYFVTGDSAGVQVVSTVTVYVATTITAAFSCEVPTACAAPAAFTFANQSQSASTYVWNFGDNHSATDTTAIHTYTAPGIYTVRLTATGACGTDSTTQVQLIHVTDITPAASGTTACYGQSVPVTAASSGTVMWYDTATGGTPVSTGTTLQTPPVMANTTYYAEAQINSALRNCGPASDNLGGGSYFAAQNLHGLLFNNTKVQQLMSVDVFAQGAGDRTILLLDSEINIIQSITVNIPSGQSTVTLDFTLPAENGMKLAIQGNINLYRNNMGAVFPYTSSDSSVTITGTDAGIAGYYYYFYNWKLRDVPCISNRIPVAVTLLNGASSFTYQAHSTSVSFTPSVTVAAGYSWNFGDGDTSMQMSPSHTYTAPGLYTVTLIETNGSCSDTTIQTVAAGVNAISEINTLQNMAIYPNPVKDQLIVKVNAALAGTYALSLTNILGQTILSKDIALTTGSNMMNEDVSALAPGIYVVTLLNGNARATGKFIKE